MTDTELMALKKKQFFTPIKARNKSQPPCHMKMLLERYGTRKDIDDHLNKENDQ